MFSVPPLMTATRVLRSALASFARHRRFTVASIATLSLGLAVTTVLFGLVYSILLRPLPFRDADRLVAISQRDRLSAQGLAPVSFPLFQDWLGSRTLDGIAALRRRPATIRRDGISGPVSVGVVSASLFPMLGVETVAGRGFRESEDRPGAAGVVILSQRFWRERFGEDVGAIGESLQIDGHTCLVVGVVSDFELPQVAGPEMWLPLSVGLDPEREAGLLEDRGQRFLSVIGRIRSEESPEAVEAELTAFLQRAEMTEEGRRQTAAVVALHDAVVGRDTRTTLMILFGASGLVLLISCVNVANLLAVRLAARRRELATRIALGCGRGELFLLLLAETVVLSFSAGGAGLLLAIGLQKVLWEMAPDVLPRMREVGVDSSASLFTIACCALIAVAFAVMATFTSTRSDPQEWLGGDSAGSVRTGRRQYWRRGLMGAEVALSVVLLVGTGLSLRSLWNLGAVDRGFVADDVLTLRIDLPATLGPQSRGALYDEILRRISELPGIERTGATQSLPLSGSMWTTTFAILGRPISPSIVTVNYARVAGDFFESMRIPLERGRYIGKRDEADTPRVAVVNAAFGTQFSPREDIVGERISIWPSDPPFEVVGVVRNAVQRQLEAPPAPMIYIPYSQRPRGSMTIVVRAAQSQTGLATAIGSEIGRLSPQARMSRFVAMEQLLDRAAVRRTYVALVLTFFGATAVILTAVGVYSVTAYVVFYRRRELGLRLALGATGTSVVRLVLWQSFYSTCLGIVAGVASAAALSGVMKGVLYGVSPTDASTFFGVSLFVLAMVVLSAFVAARRASEVDPMVTMRGERENRRSL